MPRSLGAKARPSSADAAAPRPATAPGRNPKRTSSRLPENDPSAAVEAGLRSAARDPAQRRGSDTSLHSSLAVSAAVSPGTHAATPPRISPFASPSSFALPGPGAAVPAPLPSFGQRSVSPTAAALGMVAPSPSAEELGGERGPLVPPLQRLKSAAAAQQDGASRAAAGQGHPLIISVLTASSNPLSFRVFDPALDADIDGLDPDGMARADSAAVSVASAASSRGFYSSAVVTPSQSRPASRSYDVSPQRPSNVPAADLGASGTSQPRLAFSFASALSRSETEIAPVSPTAASGSGTSQLRSLKLKVSAPAPPPPADVDADAMVDKVSPPRGRRASRNSDDGAPPGSQERRRSGGLLRTVSPSDAALRRPTVGRVSIPALHTSLTRQLTSTATTDAALSSTSAAKTSTTASAQSAPSKASSQGQASPRASAAHPVSTKQQVQDARRHAAVKPGPARKLPRCSVTGLPLSEVKKRAPRTGHSPSGSTGDRALTPAGKVSTGWKRGQEGSDSLSASVSPSATVSFSPSASPVEHPVSGGDSPASPRGSRRSIGVAVGRPDLSLHCRASPATPPPPSSPPQAFPNSSTPPTDPTIGPPPTSVSPTLRSAQRSQKRGRLSADHFPLPEDTMPAATLPAPETVLFPPFREDSGDRTAEVMGRLSIVEPSPARTATSDESSRRFTAVLDDEDDVVGPPPRSSRGTGPAQSSCGDSSLMFVECSPGTETLPPTPCRGTNEPPASLMDKASPLGDMPSPGDDDASACDDAPPAAGDEASEPAVLSDLHPRIAWLTQLKANIAALLPDDLDTFNDAIGHGPTEAELELRAAKKKEEVLSTLPDDLKRKEAEKQGGFSPAFSLLMFGSDSDEDAAAEPAEAERPTAIVSDVADVTAAVIETVVEHRAFCAAAGDDAASTFADTPPSAYGRRALTAVVSAARQGLQLSAEVFDSMLKLRQRRVSLLLLGRPDPHFTATIEVLLPLHPALQESVLLRVGLRVSLPFWAGPSFDAATVDASTVQSMLPQSGSDSYLMSPPPPGLSPMETAIRAHCPLGMHADPKASVLPENALVLSDKTLQELFKAQRLKAVKDSLAGPCDTTTYCDLVDMVQKQKDVCAALLVAEHAIEQLCGAIRAPQTTVSRTKVRASPPKPRGKRCGDRREASPSASAPSLHVVAAVPGDEDTGNAYWSDFDSVAVWSALVETLALLSTASNVHSSIVLRQVEDGRLLGTVCHALTCGGVAPTPPRVVELACVVLTKLAGDDVLLMGIGRIAMGFPAIWGYLIPALFSCTVEEVQGDLVETLRRLWEVAGEKADEAEIARGKELTRLTQERHRKLSVLAATDGVPGPSYAEVFAQIDQEAQTLTFPGLPPAQREQQIALQADGDVLTAFAAAMVKHEQHFCDGIVHATKRGVSSGPLLELCSLAIGKEYEAPGYRKFVRNVCRTACSVAMQLERMCRGSQAQPSSAEVIKSPLVLEPGTGKPDMFHHLASHGPSRPFVTSLVSYSKHTVPLRIALWQFIRRCVVADVALAAPILREFGCVAFLQAAVEEVACGLSAPSFWTGGAAPAAANGSSDTPSAFSQKGPASVADVHARSLSLFPPSAARQTSTPAKSGDATPGTDSPQPRSSLGAALWNSLTTSFSPAKSTEPEPSPEPRRRRRRPTIIDGLYVSVLKVLTEHSTAHRDSV